jgi:hypothetical protein
MFRVATAQESSIDANLYRTQIRSILADKCYTCHGPDENTRAGGFRLDRRDSAFSAADSGEIPIVPNSIERSHLLQRISASDDSVMPPADQEKQLTEKDKQLLRRWIEGGASWQNHWAFERPQNTPTPSPLSLIKDWSLAPSWQNNPIDAFVLKTLRNEGLQPSPRADKTTLIRRLTFDLTGLPPTPLEVSTFLRDKDLDAYEKVVDRLLASPHFGEHFASDWLDVARFADTNGYQNDFARNMWPWRDWVIDAFNSNMPFDQFAIEQIAGDMLPNATLNQKIATGFNRNNRSVTEGGSIEEEWHVENVVDRVETTGTAFLGLTIGCARCHDHKYDPISQREFYRFYAYFNSAQDKGVYNEARGNVGPTVPVPTKEDQIRVKQFQNEIALQKKKCTVFDETSDNRQRKWEAKFNSSAAPVRTNFSSGFLAHSVSERSPKQSKPQILAHPKHHLVDSPFNSIATQFKALNLLGDSEGPVDLDTEFEFDGDNSFSVSIWIKPKKFGAVLSRMDAGKDYRGFDILLTDKGEINIHLINQWPANAIKLTTESTVPKNSWSHIFVSYDGSKKAKGFHVTINDQLTEFKINNDNLTGSTQTDHPFWIGYRAHTSHFSGLITDLRMFDRSLTKAEASSLFQYPFGNVVQIERSERTQEQADFLRQKFKTCFSPEESKTRKKLKRLEREFAKYKSQIPTTMVMAERNTPRKTFLLNRGQYDQPDISVELTPGVPSFLPPLPPGLPSNRLGLAKWIVDPQNPLTARVAVNRFWQNYFGIGLLETPENFGVQSPLPSHPELLDWLALEFIRSGWDIKALQKRVVMSETYRQSSNVRKESLSADPNNRWLSRGPRFRLSAEAIRDNALTVSGLLTPSIGGPSMKPYQPAGLWKELAGGAGEKPYVQASDKNLYRRSLYIYRKRTVPHPTMTTFDAGSREICQVARQRTNTPLQALALLNDATYVEAARALATIAIKKSSDNETRIKLAFFRCLARHPNQSEIEILNAALERYRIRFQASPDDAQQLIQFGELTNDGAVDSTELAALTVVCSTILNLDEAITKE